jgi:leucyl-tRNA synthetase
VLDPEVPVLIPSPNPCRQGNPECTHSLRISIPVFRDFPPCVVEPLLKDPISEQDVFEAAKVFLGQEFGVPVHIVEAEGAGHAKAVTALPSRTAIVIE